MTQNYKKEIVQRITRNLLDIQILRLLSAEPMWGYKIKKQIETKYEVKLRHGALYPLLNALEEKGFLNSQQQRQGGRMRKVYTIRIEGIRYLEAYYSFLKEQLQIKETETLGTQEKNEFSILKQKAEKTN